MVWDIRYNVNYNVALEIIKEKYPKGEANRLPVVCIFVSRLLRALGGIMGDVMLLQTKNSSSAVTPYQSFWPFCKNPFPQAKPYFQNKMM